MENENLTAETNIEENSTIIAEGKNENTFQDYTLHEKEIFEEKKKVQSEEENANFARKRREIEQKQKIDEISNKVKLETAQKILNGKNPFNNKEILTIEDVDEYLNQIVKSDEWYSEDKRKFLTEFNLTENDMHKIFEDEDFLSFADGKIGKVSLVEIYRNYNNLIERFENIAKQRAERFFLNSKSSPGSLKTSDNVKLQGWSALSDSEFEEAIKKAKNGYYLKKS